MTRGEVTEPTVDEYDTERHPAWATIGASRVSTGGIRGVHLFDSDINHQHTVIVTLRMAGRKRDLHHDWIHGGDVQYEVEMSEAQWASFVSAMNSGSGVPCTLRYTATEGHTPDFPHAPRLAETLAETHRAAHDAFDGIRAAFGAYEAALKSGTARERREALNTLDARIRNAVPNVDFAGRQLVGQAEEVVQRAKADVEAFVTAQARHLGIEPGSLAPFMIEPAPEQPT